MPVLEWKIALKSLKAASKVLAGGGRREVSLRVCCVMLNCGLRRKWGREVLHGVRMWCDGRRKDLR